MSILIVFRSKHGTTLKCAEKLAGKFSADTRIVDLKKEPNIDISKFDTVIIGGSIHAGRMQKSVIKFCEKNMDNLLKKDLGLYLCCMEEGEKAQKQFDNAFPDKLIGSAKARGLLGGEFNFEKMNFLERFIIGKISGQSKSVSKINEENITDFFDKLKNSE